MAKKPNDKRRWRSPHPMLLHGEKDGPVGHLLESLKETLMSTSASNEQQPWYHEGLQFTCTGCGSCCTGEPGYVWVIQAEIEALAAALKLDVAAFEASFVRQEGKRKSLIEKENGDCVFFNGQRRSCSVYDARPRQCRTWPFWPSNLKSPRTWARVCSVCPGSGQGTLVPLAKIEAQAAVVKV